MQYFILAATLAAVASAQSTITQEVATVTEHSTTDVTITSCSNDACVSTAQSTSYSTVTTTVDGIETVYTTICPETESANKEATIAPVPAPASSETDEFVDVTVTPTVTFSTGVEATSTAQKTFTSIYNNSTSSVAPVFYSSENMANAQKAAVGLVGVAGLAAVLL